MVTRTDSQTPEKYPRKMTNYEARITKESPMTNVQMQNSAPSRLRASASLRCSACRWGRNCVGPLCAGLEMSWRGAKPAKNRLTPVNAGLNFGAAETRPHDVGGRESNRRLDARAPLRIRIASKERKAVVNMFGDNMIGLSCSAHPCLDLHIRYASFAMPCCVLGTSIVGLVSGEARLYAQLTL